METVIMQQGGTTSNENSLKMRALPGGAILNYNKGKEKPIMQQQGMGFESDNVVEQAAGGASVPVGVAPLDAIMQATITGSNSTKENGIKVKNEKALQKVKIEETKNTDVQLKKKAVQEIKKDTYDEDDDKDVDSDSSTNDDDDKVDDDESDDSDEGYEADNDVNADDCIYIGATHFINLLSSGDDDDEDDGEGSKTNKRSKYETEISIQKKLEEKGVEPHNSNENKNNDDDENENEESESENTDGNESNDDGNKNNYDNDDEVDKDNRNENKDVVITNSLQSTNMSRNVKNFVALDEVYQSKNSNGVNDSDDDKKVADLENLRKNKVECIQETKEPTNLEANASKNTETEFPKHKINKTCVSHNEKSSLFDDLKLEHDEQLETELFNELNKALATGGFEKELTCDGIDKKNNEKNLETKEPPVDSTDAVNESGSNYFAVNNCEEIFPELVYLPNLENNLSDVTAMERELDHALEEIDAKAKVISEKVQILEDVKLILPGVQNDLKNENNENEEEVDMQSNETWSATKSLNRSQDEAKESISDVEDNKITISETITTVEPELGSPERESDGSESGDGSPSSSSASSSDSDSSDDSSSSDESEVESGELRDTDDETNAEDEPMAKKAKCEN